MMDAEKPQKKTKSSPSYASPFVIVFAVMVVIAALSLFISLYAFNDWQQEKKRLLNSNAELTKAIERIKHRQSNTIEQIEVYTEKAKDNERQLESKLLGFQKALQESKSIESPNQDNWKLQKARFYLELAAINSHWSNDYKASIALLKQADDTVKSLHSINTLELRQAIAKDIASLHVKAVVDTAGLLSRLDAAADAVSRLEIVYSVGKKKEINPSDVSTSNWRTGLKSSFRALEQLVVIRRDDEEIKPLLFPLFKSLIKERVLLNLQEAQWAVLQNNPMVYQLALKQSIESLKKNFDGSKPNTKALLEQLAILQESTWTTSKPEAILSLERINAMMDNKNAKPLPIEEGAR